ncbi:MFS transporter [Edaphobacter sp.]|uniref:MFS transporter n=1 Tax=Edaphobacter sp. TaxID=1934404 RepID=UPI002DB87B83|nr:MFS transporter [Edaphobacter sp.]
MPGYIPASSTASSSTGINPGYARFLLLVAGLGGLLYGVDVGIIGGALPYLEATSGLSNSQLSIIVAAVLLGSVFSTLFAGMLADWMGRRPLMILSGVAFVLSIPIIALSHGYEPLFWGRLLQGASGGFIGIVVPLYLAECLPASDRGKGTGAFQWLLTLGIVAAALIGMYYSYRVEAVAHASSAAALLDFKDHAWRRIFWVSLPPGILFVLGSFFVTESPRWHFRKGRPEAALAALLRSRTPEQANLEMEEMHAIAAESAKPAAGHKTSGSLLQRKYVVPFVLACVILFCNTATGINSIIGYNTSILLQSGLSDLAAHWGYVIFTIVNFLSVAVGMMLVDRVGRKVLLTIGTSGIIIVLVVVGLLFRTTEKQNIDRAAEMQSLVTPDQTLSYHFTPEAAQQLIGEPDAKPASLVIVYSCGDFTSSTDFVRSDSGAAPLSISRDDCLPHSRFDAFLKNPFGNYDAARSAPLKIDHAEVSYLPSVRHGWTIAIGLYFFVAFFAFGPSVCVWLALSELMPTRIRSNGMSIALVINQLVSTILAAIFLPFVSKYGYSSMFFVFAAFTVIYFCTAVFFLPETKGKTLEEIEQFFEHGKKHTNTLPSHG